MAHAKLKRLESDGMGGGGAEVAAASPLEGSLRALQGLKVNVDVVVGNAQTTLGELWSLQQAQLLTIDRHIDAPLDLVIDGHVVARGHLVAVDEQFGIRISELVALP
jgi:flagellar motor switch protein FliN